ncbi:GNAT family N-acetyltransferase [Marilutibacter alkalisoli]|uniref:GNAT family N-acetyltransferase n=1 Tax=Marilutibacter alkalisoli TaxID=2591633 RepID=A0A514BRA2_9GAMM|nr:GNAT family N-acetyltransferase [Lysobacter alkalisoli]QDH69934.1 GNAT family N-acetyltransferase [Lysobacter alkalisoli]
MSHPDFVVEAVEYAAALPDLRAVRETVFVREQGVPAGIELDALDPLCDHVLARDTEGRPIGTGRLTPEHRIGRMAVVPDWRGRGVGDALLDALIERARAHRWRTIALHAQVDAIGFYLRHGFLPEGKQFEEAGIQHQGMVRMVDGPNPVADREAALAAMLGLVSTARRELLIYSRELDPGLLDQPELMTAFRHFAISGGELRILLQNPGPAQRAAAPLIGLAQRLPSSIGFRIVEEPVDRDFAGAYAVNDRGGWYYRNLGHRFEGETRLDAPGRARQLRALFQETWERARPGVEFRALGL